MTNIAAWNLPNGVKYPYEMSPILFLFQIQVCVRGGNFLRQDKCLSSDVKHFLSSAFVHTNPPRSGYGQPGASCRLAAGVNLWSPRAGSGFSVVCLKARTPYENVRAKWDCRCQWWLAGIRPGIRSFEFTLNTVTGSYFSVQTRVFLFIFRNFHKSNITLLIIEYLVEYYLE